MNDGQHLLWAILDEPHEDLHRLVYADWLEENGQGERAEFIREELEFHRICCQLATPYCDQDLCTDESANWCPVCGDCCCPCPEDGKNDSLCPLHAPTSRHNSDDSLRIVRWETAVRRRILLETHRKKWCDLIPGYTVDAWSLDEPTLPYVYGARVLFCRGFIAEIHCTLTDWLTHGDAIMAQHPVERVVTRKQPRHKDTGNHAGPAWFKGGYNALWESASEEDIPGEMWESLQDYHELFGWWKLYKSEQAALDALNTVLVGEWRKREQESRKIAYVIGS